MPIKGVAILAVCFPVLALASCNGGSNLECGPGTHREGGLCVPASCGDSCDCPLWPEPLVCREGLCVPAPGACVTVDDCPCARSGQEYCNAPGVCGGSA
jgi:hypothetical protein